MFKCGAYCENDGSNIVVEAGCLHGFLVCLWCASLFTKDEARSNPHRIGAQHQCSSDRLAVEQSTGSDDLHWRSREGALLPLDELCYRWNQYRCWDVTSVATTFAPLSTDNVGAHIEALLHMLGMTDHVHVQDACFMQPVDDMAWRNADGRDEEFGAGVNYDGH